MKAYSQVSDTSVFAKGRIHTSLVGSLSSQFLSNDNIESINNIGYSIGTKSGVVLKKNWVVGLNFTISQTAITNQNAENTSEDLILGPWSRFYFAKKGSGVLYIELTPFYSAFIRDEIIWDDDNNDVNKKITSGNGFGILPGFGFAYVVNRNVGFGMTINYSYAHLNAEIEDQITNTFSTDNYKLSQLQFSFNFQIYLDQFFF